MTELIHSRRSPFIHTSRYVGGEEVAWLPAHGAAANWQSLQSTSSSSSSGCSGWMEQQPIGNRFNGWPLRLWRMAKRLCHRRGAKARRRRHAGQQCKSHRQRWKRQCPLSWHLVLATFEDRETEFLDSAVARVGLLVAKAKKKRKK